MTVTLRTPQKIPNLHPNTMTRFWILSIRFFALLIPCANFANEPTPVDRFFIADDIEATVWAQAPMFFNPTNMDTDVQGRIWVTEAVNYRSFRNEGEVNLWHKDGDRVMVLEDTDHDGRADASHVFVQDKDLVAPMGLSVLDNRIIVTCSPNVIVFTDVDRNARFDPSIDTKGPRRGHISIIDKIDSFLSNNSPLLNSNL